MNKNKITSKMFLIFLILLLCLLILLTTLIKVLKKENDNLEETNNNESIVTEQKEPTVKDIIEKYDSKYISRGADHVKAVLSKGLFEEDGSSNEDFINNIITDLIPFYTPGDFYVLDEEKELEIYARYNKKDDSYEVVINEIEDFFNKIDGEAYVKVDTTEIADGIILGIKDPILDKLIYNEFYASYIEEMVGEGKELGNGYTSYQNGKVKIRTVPTGAVKNIIFSDSYEEYLTYSLNTQMSLEKVAEVEPQFTFGSVGQGYLGYRQLDYYLFFYEDEVSVYTYSYQKNIEFEEILQEYLKTKDLERFVKLLSKKWKAYDYLEYDKENQNARIMYSTRGVDIDIKNNDTTGITFYSNYYLTDYIRKLVKTGVVSFEADQDLVQKYEFERRNNN